MFYRLRSKMAIHALALSKSHEPDKRLASMGLKAIPWIVDALPAAAPDVKKRLFAVLAEIGGNGAADILADNLSNPEGIGYCAAMALARLKDKRAISPLRAMIEARPDGAQDAVESLGNIGGADATDALVASVIFSTNSIGFMYPWMEKAYLMAFQQLGEQAVFKLAVLLDSSPRCAHVALRVIGQIPCQQSAAILERLLLGSEHKFAEKHLRSFPDSLLSLRARAAVACAKRDWDYAIRFGAVAIEFLLRQMRSSLPESRVAIVEALAQIDSEDITPPLLSILLDDSRQVREAAVDALVGIGGRESLIGLLKHLNRVQSDKWEYGETEKAVAFIAKEDELECLHLLERCRGPLNSQKSYRKVIARALAKSKSTSRGAVMQLLTDEDFVVFSEALAILKEGQNAESIFEALATAKPDRHKNLLAALFASGERRWIDAAMARLQASDLLNHAITNAVISSGVLIDERLASPYLEMLAGYHSIAIALIAKTATAEQLKAIVPNFPTAGMEAKPKLESILINVDTESSSYTPNHGDSDYHKAGVETYYPEKGLCLWDDAFHEDLKRLPGAGQLTKNQLWLLASGALLHVRIIEDKSKEWRRNEVNYSARKLVSTNRTVVLEDFNSLDIDYSKMLTAKVRWPLRIIRSSAIQSAMRDQLLEFFQHIDDQ